MFLVAVLVSCLTCGPARPADMKWMPQIQLSERMILNYLGAQKLIDKLTTEDVAELKGMQAGNPELQRDIQTAVMRNGFANFHEYRIVVGNIAIIMSGLDPKTKTFTEPL